MPEVLKMMKFLQTKQQNKSMNIKYYDLHYTVIKNRNDKKIVNDEYKNKENDYNYYDDFVKPNQYIGRQNGNVIFR